MNSISFKKNLLSVQEELLRFAYKLTADREEANDLLQETSMGHRTKRFFQWSGKMGERF